MKSISAPNDLFKVGGCFKSRDTVMPAMAVVLGRALNALEIAYGNHLLEFMEWLDECDYET